MHLLNVTNLRPILTTPTNTSQALLQQHSTHKLMLVVMRVLANDDSDTLTPLCLDSFVACVLQRVSGRFPRLETSLRACLRSTCSEIVISFAFCR